MAEADGIGAAAADTGRDDQVGGLVETLRTSSSSCDALPVADDERSKLYVTAPLEVAQAGSSKSMDLTARRVRLEQLPSGPKCSADDEYWTARRRRLEQLRSECGSEAEFEMAKSREHWTVVGEPSSELDLTYVANRQHFQRLLDQDQESQCFLNELEVFNRLLDENQISHHVHILGDEDKISQDIQGLLDKYQISQYPRNCSRYLKRVGDEYRELIEREEREGPQEPQFPDTPSFLGCDASFFVEYDDSELVVGEKINEGGQAEIFQATFRDNDMYVLKVFKPDISLADFQRHWTFRTVEGLYYKKYAFTNCCFIESGTLLKDGRFAFLMERYWGDLRKLIDQNMKANNEQGPPFSPFEALYIMYSIAKGMMELHNCAILHKDLKSANVLIKKSSGHSNEYYVADYESSGGGVQGTGFWRAPEVLQLVKDKVRDPRAWNNIWSIKVDVYSYAMTSYEVLTGLVPLGHLAAYEYDVVLLKGERPLLPNYIDSRIQVLLSQCWHSDPLQRPDFDTILGELIGH